jgi:REP element-mobilizing transposase RayT
MVRKDFFHRKMSESVRIITMNEEQFPGRRSIRLKGYDSSQAGGYFVTIVTLWRECPFGEIARGEMRPYAMGRIVEECWHAIPEHFPNTDVDVFVVMPNHVHRIVMIHKNMGRDTMPIAMARHASPLPPRGTPPVSLGAIIGSFKPAVTRRAGRELNIANIWQRNCGACPE